ncbi:MAG: BTAD domain-containing putative transcriptional regulator [Ktedonobacteraceae bacterium]
MQDASLLRKIVRPTLPAVFLHRIALVTQLQEAITPELHTDDSTIRYKLVLCCAPAGYGKTTLLADFAHSTSLPCCWYFLEHGDTDPMVFLRTLLASLRQVFPQFGVSLDPVFHTLLPDDASSALSISHSMLDTLCAALATEIPEHFALILSNYEEVNDNGTLTDLVNDLLKKLPPQATLIIESRVMPDISFTSFVIHDTMCGLDRDALRFSPQDITELARLQGLPPLTDAEAEHLATAFDGWIAGILLGTRVGDARLRLLTQSAFQREHLPRLPGKSLVEHHRKTLFTYVVDEVLKHDTTAYTFLQTISVLQQIEPALCNALLARTDAAERLALLERQGLFLTAHESAFGTTYTCHPVIRDLLSEQLHQREPERFLALHRQAIALWHASHNDEQAMYHALAIGAYDLAVSLILNAAEHLLQQGQRETLVRWLHALPSAVQENHPQVLVLQATMALGRGQHTVALPLLERAEELVSDSVKTERHVFQAMIAILRSKALFQAGAYPQAEALCQQVLLHVPAREQALRAAAETRLGICANLQGQFTSGITHLQQALHIWANQPPLTQAMDIHSALANTYYLTGNFLLAKHHLTAVLAACEQVHDVAGKESALILHGLMAQDLGLAAEAEATFLQALALARTVPHAQRGEAYALVNLSSLAVEQGQYAQALTYAEQGLTLAQTFGNRSLVNDALMSRALSYLFLGDPVSALLSVEHMETQAVGPQIVGYERVWRDLTYGLIFLSQSRYEEAAAYLAEIEAALQISDLKRGSFQAKLRLAACRIAQEQPEEMLRLLKEVALLLAAHRTYTHLVQIELQWLPTLLPVVQNHPQLAPLRTLLAGVEPLHPQNEQDPSPASPALAEFSSPTLTMCAFGEPMVLLDGQPIKRWRIALVKELFFFLLDADHPISKEAILTALWPAYDEQTTRTFHDTLYHLRKLFGEASVVFHAGVYHLDLAACYGAQVFYDVQAFQQHQMEAEQALTLDDEARAKGALLNMVQLYRGDYGRAFYNDWCTFRRDELRAAYLEARRQLAQIAWRADAWSESAEHWRQMLRIDTCLEEAHYNLMRCYVRQGKRGAALRQYQTCQNVLEEELGVQPSQALLHLYQRLTTKQYTPKQHVE